MGVTVDDRDTGWKKLAAVAGKTVWVKAQSVATNTTGHMYGWYVENGTRNMHGRHYTSKMLEAHNNYRQQMGKIMDRVVGGQDMLASAEKFGAEVKAGMRRTIWELGLYHTRELYAWVKSAAKIGDKPFPRGTWKK